MPLDDGGMTETCCGNNIRGGEEELLCWQTINCWITVQEVWLTTKLILECHREPNFLVFSISTSLEIKYKELPLVSSHASAVVNESSWNKWIIDNKTLWKLPIGGNHGICEFDSNLRLMFSVGLFVLTVSIWCISANWGIWLTNNSIGGAP
jgi:hypothetical protein